MTRSVHGDRPIVLDPAASPNGGSTIAETKQTASESRIEVEPELPAIDRGLIEGPPGMPIEQEHAESAEIEEISVAGVPATVSDAKIDELATEFCARSETELVALGVRLHSSLGAVAEKVRAGAEHVGTRQLVADAGRYFGEVMHLAHVYAPALNGLGAVGLAVAALHDVMHLVHLIRHGGSMREKLLATARIGVDIAVALSPLVIVATVASLVVTATEYAMATDGETRRAKPELLPASEEADTDERP